MRKVLIATAVLAALALGGYVARRAYEKVSEQIAGRPGRRTAAVPVEIAPVRKVTLRDVGRFWGGLFPDSQFVVAPRIAGRLKKLLVDIGDKVERGQVIAALDDQEYVEQEKRAKAELAVAKATVEECRSNLETAKREFERALALLEKKIASESEYDQAKAQYEVQKARCQVAAAQVDQKLAALEEAGIRRSYARIAAVWEDGTQTRVVGERYVDEGALLAANAPIVSILDIGTLTAVVHVGRDYAKISVGQEAALTTDAFPGRVFKGNVARIAPQLKETSRQGRVEIAVPNAEGLLKPGMFAEVGLEFAEHRDVAAVPTAAMARGVDGQWGVFVADVKAGTARFVPVEKGITSGGLVEVVSPPLDGPVVVMGQHLLEDGAAITVPQEAGEGAEGDGENQPPAGDEATPREVRP